ncbi:hypothetical protein CBR_g48397 [Chara braunii]|uniref:Uncharacterized protein n=1 Tax=Chara braunii TaxID=69332 RepID=A0A388M2H9_CHABU|nr:hypothetical protein CBR_g48397 [Chara braunii]|eukprot:GBG88780.1 hypothetical protein CBR_g48397 [Chara braunii]
MAAISSRNVVLVDVLSPQSPPCRATARGASFIPKGLERSVLRSGWKAPRHAAAAFGLRRPGRQRHREQKMGFHPLTTHEQKVEHGVKAAKTRNDNLASTSDFLEEKDVDDFLNMEWKDGELDEVFEKFGETVYVDPNLEELAKADEDDAEVEKFAIAMATAAYDTKAVDIRVLHVKPLVQWTRYFVIVSAFSRPQIDAIM